MSGGDAFRRPVPETLSPAIEDTYQPTERPVVIANLAATDARGPPVSTPFPVPVG